MRDSTRTASVRPCVTWQADGGRADSLRLYGANTRQQTASKEATPTDPPKRGLSVGIDSAIKKHGFPAPQEQIGYSTLPPIFFVRQISTPPTNFLSQK